jgi:hypothetical protein
VSPFLIAGRASSVTAMASAPTDRVYVAPDVRIAAEDLHLRLTVSVGVKL